MELIRSKRGNGQALFIRNPEDLQNKKSQGSFIKGYPP